MVKNHHKMTENAKGAADIFDSALNLEEQHVDEGYQAGLEAGRQAGRAEGCALGLRKGYEVGSELGHYSGCCQLWCQLQAKQPGFIPARADKAVAALEQLIADFPLSDAQDERLQELMDSIRGRFKAVTAMLGLQEAYAQQAQQQQQQQQGGGLQF